jgi:DNA-binding CsgD family transcriptional regulator/catechol 2,3-dioxygenase-like lactoylglutathione lyase family enzyme
MSQTRQRGRPPHPDILTPGEWRIVDSVRHGMTNRQIARRRGISLDAVKFHVANAMDKLSLRTRGELKYWRGAPRGSALERSKPDMIAELKLGPIGQISREVSDIARAVDWYRDVLGLPHLYTFGDLAFFDCGGTRLFLIHHTAEGTGEGSGGDSILYFRVDDINSAYDQLMARGIAFIQAPHMIHKHENGTEEWMAFFNDPDGRPLAIMSQVMASM